MTEPSHQASPGRILTVPNVLSALRIALIPVFVALIVDDDATRQGLVLFAVVAATDWLDGWIARRFSQTSELGKVLDPLADRLAIAAGLLALAIRGAVPWWAAVLILVRDGAVLVVGAVVMARRGVRIDVRWLGKVATFALMAAIVWIAWGNLGYALEDLALVLGWGSYGVGIVLSYAAAALYLGDLRATLRRAG